MQKLVSLDVYGLKVSAKLVDLGHEGDGDVPGGLHHLGYHFEDMVVITSDGTDIYDMLSDSAIDDIEDALSEVYCV